MIQRLSPGPYLELFARRPMPGWDVWGNQVNATISIPSYPVPSDIKKTKVSANNFVMGEEVADA